MFAIFCLFDDLQNIRVFLTQTWKDYAANNIDLMAASVTTNTAFDLAREQCEEFVKRYPDLDGFNGASTIIFTLVSITGKGLNYKQEPGDPWDFDLTDVAEWCLFPVYQMLDAFTRVFVANKVPIYNGQFGWYKADDSREKMTTREKYNDDRAFLYQHLSEFAFLADVNHSIPVIDELTRGLVDMRKTKKVPIWLAFAAQIFLDIKNATRTCGDKAFSDLRMTGLRTKKIIDDHFKAHEKLPDAEEIHWPKQNNQVLREVKTTIEMFIEKDWFLSCMKKDIMRTDATVADYALYKSHPVLCGVLVFHLNIRMQELGLILMNAWGTGLYAAYMYNAIQQDASEIDVTWPDMDKLIELHSEEHLFYGPRPVDHEDSFKKICLATGMSASAFAGGSKMPHRMKKNKEARGLEERSVISKVYRERYCYGETIDLSTSNIQSVLDDLASKKAAAATGSKRMRKKFEKTQKLTPLQLLTALQERLVDEEQCLKFNYIGMNSRVIQLFHLTRQAVDVQMMSKFGPDYMADERQICSIVHWMLTYASFAAKGMQVMGLYKPGMKFGSKCISTAGNVLKSWSVTNGSVGVKELDAFCTNKPKMDKATRTKAREQKVMFFFAMDELLGTTTVLGA
ncbi:hypothetical protein R6Q59_009828 [Mikania micrantha]